MISKQEKVEAGAKEARKAINGNMSELARRIGITPQSVQEWFERGVIPAKRVIQVSNITGVKKEVLRPDLYE